MRTKPSALARRYWTLGLLVVLCLAGVLILRPAEGQTTDAVVHARGRPDTTVTLLRNADRWVGHAADFPPGSVAHFQPPERPGFLIVRDTGGAFWALSDRSPHRGQPLEYRDRLPGTSTHAAGPQPGFYDPAAGANHTLDGEPFQGPAPRPMDPFPVAVQDQKIEIATHAVCPADLSARPEWCGSGQGPRALAAGKVAILVLPGSQLEVLGGTMLDLVDRFGLGNNGPSWIQPGAGRPVFALVQALDCASGPLHRQSSEWLTLSMLLATSRAAVDPCGLAASPLVVQ